MRPTTLTEMAYARSMKSRKKCVCFKGDNNRWYISDQIEEVFGVGLHKLWRRISRFGLGSPLLLCSGNLLPGFRPVPRLEEVATEWDRRKCKRNHHLCMNYHICQEKRLGLSQDKWIAPKNTDKCYVEEVVPYRGLIKGSLDGKFGLGVIE